MKRLFFIGIFITAFAAVLSAQTELPSIHYKIKPVPKADRTDLHISVSAKFASDKPQNVSITKNSFGLQGLFRAVASIEGEQGTTVTPGKADGEWTLQPDAKSEARFKYIMSYDPARMRDGTFAPNTGAKHFHFFGHQALLQIGDGKQTSRFIIEMTDLPSGWKTHSSQSADPLRTELEKTYDRLLTTAYGGNGAFAKQFIFHGKPVSVFIGGDFKISPAEMYAAVKKIVEFQRDFFKDYDQKFYNIVLMPKEGNVAGMRIANQFVCFLKPDITPEQLYGLLAHEMAHNWLKPEIFKAQEGNDTLRHTWFTEGVNDYMARRLLLDAGLLTREKFADLANRDVINIADNPNRAATFKQAMDAVENGKYDQAFVKLAYYRGGLMGLNWDAQIRRARKGTLGDLIKHIYNDSVKKGGLTEDEFFALAAEYGVDAKGDFERYVVRGEPIPVMPHAMGNDFVQRETMIPAFDRGFTSEGNKITKVAPDGPAYRAGMRVGMEIVRVQYPNRFGGAWDPNEQYVIFVKDNGKELRLAYSPYGKSRPLKLFHHVKPRKKK